MLFYFLRNAGKTGLILGSLNSSLQEASAMDWHRLFLLLLQVSTLPISEITAAFAKLNKNRLAFVQHSKCTYSYEVAVHTARGSKSSENDGYQLHALVSTLRYRYFIH